MQGQKCKSRCISASDRTIPPIGKAFQQNGSLGATVTDKWSVSKQIVYDCYEAAGQ